MSQEARIKQLLNSIKIDVENIDSFEKDIDSILGMFNQIKDVDVAGIEANLDRKRVTLENLRTDEAIDVSFRKDLRGKYFKVPNVSKK